MTRWYQPRTPPASPRAAPLASPPAPPRLGLLLVGGPLATLALFAPWLAPHDPQAQELLYTTAACRRPGPGRETPLPRSAPTRSGAASSRRLIHGARGALAGGGHLRDRGAMLLGATLRARRRLFFGGWLDWDRRSAGGHVDGLSRRSCWRCILLVGLGAGVDQGDPGHPSFVDWTIASAASSASEVLVIKTRDYVAAARLSGFSHLQTIVREVLPAVAPLLATLFTLEDGDRGHRRADDVLRRPLGPSPDVAPGA